MGIKVSIDVNFSQEYSPKEVLKLLMSNGWGIYYQNIVTYLSSKDVDSYDWQDMDVNFFDFYDFINSHDAMGKVGVVMVFDGISGGEVIIYPNCLSMLLSINCQHLSGSDIPDFNWYLKRMSGFLNSIKLSSIECESIY